MDWQKIVQELIASGVTRREIVEKAGFSSDSTVSEILSGHIKKVYWDRGDRLLAMHKMATRNVPKKAA